MKKDEDYKNVHLIVTWRLLVITKPLFSGTFVVVDIVVFFFQINEPLSLTINKTYCLTD